jgi:hypothetical protein
MRQPTEFASQGFRWLRAGAAGWIAPLHLTDLVVDAECVDRSAAHPLGELVSQQSATFSGLQLYLIEPAIHFCSGFHQRNHRLSATGPVDNEYDCFGYFSLLAPDLILLVCFLRAAFETFIPTDHLPDGQDTQGRQCAHSL